MRILIADDDAMSRMILQAAVKALGHACVVVEDGLDAWRRFQEGRFDVVISDWMMPGIDGIELCRRIRHRAESSPTYTYFIFLTARGEKEHLLMAMEAGGDDYLTKPLDRVDLKVQLNVAARVTSLYRQVAEQATELERLNQELHRQARRDPLTGLGNRLLLQEDLETLHARMERYGHTYCAAICDVDFFKRYNDSYGHLAGDEVLRAVADSITASIRQADRAYRYGGEEFVIILPEQSLASARVAAERIRRTIEDLAIPHAARTPPSVVTVSVGVASLLAEKQKSADTLLREADNALYRAKDLGRNRVVIQGGAPLTL